MPLFRSLQDRNFIRKLNHELIEKVIGEKITYYPISRKLTNVNIYGESVLKTFDPPVQVYGMIEWSEQEITTTEFGQDVVYKLKCYMLQEHMDQINLLPKEGDMIDYNNVKFEITDIQNPDLLFGKTQESFNFILNCKSVRDSVFRSIVSGTIDNHTRTRPDNYTSSSINYSNSIYFPFSGSESPL